MNNITNEKLDGLIKAAVNSSGPLPPDEKFSQIISALRELRDLRTAMLQGNQAPVKQPSSNGVIGWLRSDYNSDDKRDPNAPLFMLGSNDPSEAWGVKYIPLSGNSPVIPDGWVMVPVDMTPEQMRAVQIKSELGSYAAANLSGAYALFREFWDVSVAAAPQQEAE